MINLDRPVILRSAWERAISGPVNLSLVLAAEWPRSKARGDAGAYSPKSAHWICAWPRSQQHAYSCLGASNEDPTRAVVRDERALPIICDGSMADSPRPSGTERPVLAPRLYAVRGPFFPR